MKQTHKENLYPRGIGKNMAGRQTQHKEQIIRNSMLKVHLKNSKRHLVYAGTFLGSMLELEKRIGGL